MKTRTLPRTHFRMTAVQVAVLFLFAGIPG